MKFERTKNASRNFVFGLLYNIVSIVFPFVVRTIIIHKLGTDYAGLSGLYSSILSMLNMANLGIGSAVAFCLYKPIAEDDTDTICALLGFLKKFYKIICVVILSLGLLCIPLLPRLIKGSCPPDINLYVLYIIYLLETVISYAMFAYKSVIIEAYQRSDIIHKMQCVIEIVKYTLQIIVLIVFANYYLYAFFLLIGVIGNNIVILKASNKYFPECQPRGKIDVNYGKIIKQKTTYLALHSITSTLTNSADNIIISAKLGLTAIALYGNYSYISSAVFSVILIAFKSVKSAIGNVIVSEDSEQNYVIFKSISFVCNWICIWFTTCLICLFQPFMKIWVGEQNMLPLSAAVVISLYFFVNCQDQFLTVTYISSAGLWNKTLGRKIFSTTMNLFLDLVLAQKYGVFGVVFASLFTVGCISYPLDVFVVYKNVLGVPVKKAVMPILKSVVRLAICAGVCFFLCNNIADRISGFVGRLVICAVVPNIILFLSAYKTKEFEYMREHLLLILPEKIIRRNMRK